MKKREVNVLVVVALLLMPVMAFADTAGSITSMLQNVAQSVPGVVQLTFAVCYVVGLWEVLRSIYKLKRYAQGQSMMSQEASLMKPVIHLFVGVGCLYLPSMMDSFLQTAFGTDINSVVAYPAEDSDPFVSVVRPLILVTRAFGLIAIVRGWIMLAKLGGEGAAQPGTTGKAVMHILGGICAWNIVGLWTVIQNTLGIS